MTYNNAVPQGNQQIAATQAPILGNFSYIDTAMKIDHAWNGNEIASQAAGSHQQIQMPNQAVDWAVSNAGIAATLYCKGGNLFSYNGVKNAVSAVSVTGSQLITTVVTTLFTVPADCIGFIHLQMPAIFPTVTSYAFSSIAGVLYLSFQTQINGSQQVVNLTASGLNVQVARSAGSNYIANFKYIYWPI